jgi:hypothetical protein
LKKRDFDNQIKNTMKKIQFLYIIFCLMAVIIIMVSCLRGKGVVVSKTFDVKSFSGITNNIDADIHITQALTQSIEIVAQQNIINNISLEVTNGILTINFKKKAIHYDTININISIPTLSWLSLDGSGNMNTINTFDSCRTVSINLDGSGKIDASFNSNVKTYLTINGSGNITITGNSFNQDITIRGSGNVHAFSFDTYHSVVNISGSGSCELTADSTLNVKFSGSGNVNYKGHPVINSTITGSGTIHNSN